MRKLLGSAPYIEPYWTPILTKHVTSANLGFDLFDDEQLNIKNNAHVEPSSFIIDIREYDVPYHVRVSIDKGMPIFISRKWFWADPP